MYKITATKNDGSDAVAYEFTDAQTLRLVAAGIENHVAGLVMLEYVGEDK